LAFLVIFFAFLAFLAFLAISDFFIHDKLIKNCRPTNFINLRYNFRTNGI